MSRMSGISDMLFNVLLIFVVLFFLLLLLLKTEETPAGVRYSGEAVLVLVWDVDKADDLDLYVRDPEGRLVWYHNKRSPIMHLDRDDLGKSNDLEGAKFNQEVVTFRSLPDGEYLVAVHNFRGEGEGSMELRLFDLAPVLTQKFVKSFPFPAFKQETFVARFTVSNGSITVGPDGPKVKLRVL